MMKSLDPSMPLERSLPAPFRQLWTGGRRVRLITEMPTESQTLPSKHESNMRKQQQRERQNERQCKRDIQDTEKLRVAMSSHIREKCGVLFQEVCHSVQNRLIPPSWFVPTSTSRSEMSRRVTEALTELSFVDQSHQRTLKKLGLLLVTVSVCRSHARSTSLNATVWMLLDALCLCTPEDSLPAFLSPRGRAIETTIHRGTGPTIPSRGDGRRGVFLEGSVEDVLLPLFPLDYDVDSSLVAENWECLCIVECDARKQADVMVVPLTESLGLDVRLDLCFEMVGSQLVAWVAAETLPPADGDVVLLQALAYYSCLVSAFSGDSAVFNVLSTIRSLPVSADWETLDAFVKEEVRVVSGKNIEVGFVRWLDSLGIESSEAEVKEVKRRPAPRARKRTLPVVPPAELPRGMDTSFLPVRQRESQIRTLVESNRVVVIKGETGSGKSTQVPRILLEMITKGSTRPIYCSQPRRLAASSLYARVSQEVGHPGAVGYVVRGEGHQVPGKTRLLYCTHGILLKLLVECPVELEFVVVDEVHERSTDVDLLLLLLKLTLKRNPNLRVVVMSASVDALVFSQYFGQSAAAIEIEGRTFPVQTRFLNDLEALPRVEPCDRCFADGLVCHQDRVAVVKAVVEDIVLNTKKPGCILVFVLGVEEAQSVKQALHSMRECEVLLCYRGLDPKVQNRVFDNLKPKWKIVVATNIAETSITIDDVSHVIDTGLHKVPGYRDDGMVSTLLPRFIAKANHQQRIGRAGRVSSGKAFCLYSRTRLEATEDAVAPEIVSTTFEGPLLKLMTMVTSETPIERLLSMLLSSPSEYKAKTSLMVLESLGFVSVQDGMWQLTNQGKLASQLPVDPRIAKCIIMSDYLGVLEIMTPIAAILQGTFPFARLKETKIPAVGCCDFVTQYLFYREFKRSKNQLQWCEENGILYRAFVEDSFAERNIRKALSSIRKTPVSSELPDVSFRDVKCLKAALASGLYPLVAKFKRPEVRYMKVAGGATKVEPSLEDITLLCPRCPIKIYETAGDLPLQSSRDQFLDIHKVYLGRKSLNRAEGHMHSQFMLFYEKMDTGKASNIGITTPLGAFPLLIGGAFRLESRLRPGKSHECLVDRWFVVDTPGQTAAFVRALQSVLQVCLDHFLWQSYKDIDPPMTTLCQLPSDPEAARCLFVQLLEYSGVSGSE